MSTKTKEEIDAYCAARVEEQRARSEEGPPIERVKAGDCFFQINKIVCDNLKRRNNQCVFNDDEICLDALPKNSVKTNSG